MVVNFAHQASARRKNVPIGGELRLGVNGEGKLPKGVTGKSAGANSAPSIKGGMSGIGGRGDWT